MPVVSPDDVAALQASVRALRDSIQFSIGACPAAKADAVLMAQWDAYDDVVNAYLEQSPSWLFTAAQMDEGQAIQKELGNWTTRIAAKGCSNVPPKPPEPPASGLAQATSLVAEVVTAAVVITGAILVLRFVKVRR